MLQPLSVLLLLFVSGAAHAEWMEASSDHFVVYGDTGEQKLRRVAEQLERFDAAMAMVTGAPRTKPSRSARVTVYMTGTDRDLRKLFAQNGDQAGFVAGFYMPVMSGPVAFVPDVTTARNADDESSFPMFVLLHEYAHHFTFMHSRFTAPRWYNEGLAEFFASAGFKPDGSVTLGRPSRLRGAELFMAGDVTVTDLVDQEHYEKRKGDDRRYDAYYGRAWLLFHYLTFEPSRQQQRRAYVAAMAAGKPSRQAAEEAFGDLDKLDKELDAYMIRSNLKVLTIKGGALPTGDITLQTLSPGEAAVMPVVMRSKRGVGSKELAAAIVADARAVAAKFPADPAVLAALAEAEHDAGDDDAAVAAADAALALDPGKVDAHVQKVYSLFSKASKTKSAAGMDEARRALLALNGIEKDHPVPLVYFYRSFLARDEAPTTNAVAGLERGAAVAPFANEVSLMLARQYLVDGKIPQARQAMQPAAYNPHGGKNAEKLRGILARLEGADAAAASAVAAELRELGKQDEEKKAKD
ncbi:MAG: DUF1570 domain-containing protein [Gammaproteobacteria bacterium]|nr:DUF1570 domain-containing protein [Gammaproteobacteria bacterium]